MNQEPEPVFLLDALQFSADRHRHQRRKGAAASPCARAKTSPCRPCIFRKTRYISAIRKDTS